MSQDLKFDTARDILRDLATLFAAPPSDDRPTLAQLVLRARDWCEEQSVPMLFTDHHPDISRTAAINAASNAAGWADSLTRKGCLPLALVGVAKPVADDPGLSFVAATPGVDVLQPMLVVMGLRACADRLEAHFRTEVIREPA